MKKYLSIIILSLVVFSCKKESASSSAPRPWLPASNYITVVKNYLKENLADSDYVNVDFNNTIISKQPAGWFLRIAFLHKLIKRDFVLLQTDSIGNINAGKFVHIVRNETNQKVFNGTVTTESLLHTKVQNSVITNGAVRLYSNTCLLYTSFGIINLLFIGLKLSSPPLI